MDDQADGKGYRAAILQAVEIRQYRSAASDNARWEGFVHRPGDIFVCSPPKCGTTWTQTIVAALLWPDGDMPGPVMAVMPWLDAKFAPVEEVLARLEAQQRRRSIKTHTPADGIPHWDDAFYLVVFRDGRDAFMSYANHMDRFRADVRRSLNERAAADGIDPMIAFDGDYHRFFDSWLAQAGRMSPAHHLATWWPRRHHANVRLVHYNDLKADLGGQMRSIAAFLGVEVAEERWPALVERCTFEGMRARGGEIGEFERTFEGGADSFLFKGVNGRWTDVLTDEELERYRVHVESLLPPEAGEWLVHGSLAATT